MDWPDYARFVLSECPVNANRASFIRRTLIRNLRAHLSAGDAGSQVRSYWMVEYKNMFNRYEFWSVRILVGRDRENDIQLKDSAVSKRHLMLAFDLLNWWAIDLKSKNGIRDHESNWVSCTVMSPGRPLYLGNSKLIYLP